MDIAAIRQYCDEMVAFVTCCSTTDHARVHDNVKGLSRTVQAAIALNRETPPAILKSFLDGSNKWAHDNALNNPALPEQVVFDAIDKASWDQGGRELCEAAAKSPFSSPNILRRIAASLPEGDPYAAEETCFALSENSNTPPSVLEKIYSWGRMRKHYKGWVFYPGGTSDIFIAMAGCFALSENSNTPPSVLEKIYSWGRMRKHYKGWVFYPGGTSDIFIAMAGNPNTPSAILKAFLRDDDAVLRMVAASNETLSQNEIDDNAASWDVRIRCGVAMNPSAPLSALVGLSKDRRGIVKTYVARNPKTPADILKSFYLETDNEDGAESGGYSPDEGLSKDRRGIVKTYVARNPKTPADILKSFYLETDNEDGAESGGYSPDDMRLSLAMNPSTPSEVLKRLAREGSSTIQLAVVKNRSTLEADILATVPFLDISACSEIANRDTLKASDISFVLKQVVEKANSSEKYYPDQYIDGFLCGLFGRLTFSELHYWLPKLLD